MKLVRIKEGVDFRKWKPVYYIEARLSARRLWVLVTDGFEWTPHYDRASADRAAGKLQKMLARKNL